MHFTTCTKAPWYKDDVGWRMGVVRVVGINAELIPRHHRLQLFCHQRDLEWLHFLLPTGHREDFKRASEVEHFDIIENSDGNVPARHGNSSLYVESRAKAPRHARRILTSLRGCSNHSFPYHTGKHFSRADTREHFPHPVF